MSKQEEIEKALKEFEFDLENESGSKYKLLDFLQKKLFFSINIKTFKIDEIEERLVALQNKGLNKSHGKIKKILVVSIIITCGLREEKKFNCLNFVCINEISDLNIKKIKLKDWVICEF